jgi:hypothetical protein
MRTPFAQASVAVGAIGILDEVFRRAITAASWSGATTTAQRGQAEFIAS